MPTWEPTGAIGILWRPQLKKDESACQAARKSGMLAEIYPQRLGARLVGVEAPEEAFAQPGPCQSDDRVS